MKSAQSELELLVCVMTTTPCSGYRQAPYGQCKGRMVQERSEYIGSRSTPFLICDVSVDSTGLEWGLYRGRANVTPVVCGFNLPDRPAETLACPEIFWSTHYGSLLYTWVQDQ